MKIRKMRKRVRASKRISFRAELHALMELSFKLLTTCMSSDDKMRAMLDALAKSSLSMSTLHKNG